MARQPILPSLIILPPPPVPATPAALKAAYSPSITAALIALNNLHSRAPAILELVLPCPGIYDRLRLPRSQLFKEIQHLLAKLYSLVAIVCVNNSIDLDLPGGVDVRVLLLAYQEQERFSCDDELPTPNPAIGGPIIDFPTLAMTRRRWHYVFQVEGEQGLEFYCRYLNIVKRTSPPIHGQNRIVAGGISLISEEPVRERSPERVAQTHKAVILGGTFDHLHAGHKLLLTATALLLQEDPGQTKQVSRPLRFVIGLTGDEMLKNKKYAEYMQSWEERQQDTVNFLASILSFSRSPEQPKKAYFDEPVVNGKAIHTTFIQAGITIECVEIQDPFGPTITDQSVTALVVSGETRSGGAAVNTKRKEKGWSELEVFEVDVLDAHEDTGTPSTTESFDAKISSSAIRKRKAEMGHGSAL